MTSDFTDERELVEALVANDPAAWDVFVSRYRNLVMGVARQTLRKSGARDPESLAHDVTSEVFAELLSNERRALTRFREPWSLKGWLSVVTSRRAKRVLRGARRGGVQELETPQGIPAEGRSPASEVGQIEQFSLVRSGLEELKPRDRLALQLFYEGGHSYKEVAEILHLPVARVGTVLARARSRLARALGH